MAGKSTWQTQGYVYYDPTDNKYPLAPFQSLSLATSSEITAAIAAGIRDAVIGRVVVPTPTGTVLSVTMGNRRCVGISLNACKSGDEVSVTADGVADVMVNAAVACDAVVYVASQATRTSAQTPFTNLSEALLAVDPDLTLTYNLSLVDDLSPTFDSSGANVAFYPVGVALAAATAQYDVIPVQLYQPGVLFG